MNLELLIDVLWLVVITFGGWRYGADRFPGGPLGGAITWLLAAVFGVILIHLLLAASGAGYGYRPTI